MSDSAMLRFPLVFSCNVVRQVDGFLSRSKIRGRGLLAWTGGQPHLVHGGGEQGHDQLFEVSSGLFARLFHGGLR